MYTLTPAQNGIYDILGTFLCNLSKGLKEFVELWVEGRTKEVSQYRITILGTRRARVNNGS